jgi:DNA-binding SARP family transcriptional activator/tetratricopeptide (TPR) repeat protein
MTVSEIDSGGAAEFEIRLLGSIQALYQGEELNLRGVQARGILATLALNVGKVVPHEVIIANAWRGQRSDAPDTVRDLIATYVSNLRKALKPASELVELRAKSPGFVLTVDRANADVIDAVRFRRLLRDAERAGMTADLEIEARLLQEAVDSWHGEHLALADAKAEGLRAEAAALQAERRGALVRLAALYVSDGQAARASALLVPEARRAPADDEVAAGLVEALSADARPTEAFDTAQQIAAARRALALPVGPRLKAALGYARTAAEADNGMIGPLHQLPIDPGGFTGREPELTELLALADTAREKTVVISAIDGMGGIGKTALAVHAGHRLIDRFPDGQLFINLHGYTPGRAPLAATDVLADILRAFAIPVPQIPEDLDARAALYRDRLTGKRMLIVLDNASTEDQIRPLLPGHPECLVIVTSRVRLSGLDDALVLSLDPLPLPDAIRLLRTIAGPDRIPANDPLLERITEWCGRLPLALRIAGALMGKRRPWTLQDLAIRLEDERKRLSALSDKRDKHRNLIAVFNLSLAALTEDQRSFFRHLGLNPGADIDAYAAAALLDTDLDSADALLQHLVDHNLLLEPVAGRYQLHDLLRLHAQSLAMAVPAPQRCDALMHLSAYYYYTSIRAEQQVFRDSREVILNNFPHRPRHLPALNTLEQGLVWLRNDTQNTLDATEAYALANVIVAGVPPSVVHCQVRSLGPWCDAGPVRGVYEQFLQQMRLVRQLMDQALSGDHGAVLDTFPRMVKDLYALAAAVEQARADTGASGAGSPAHVHPGPADTQQPSENTTVAGSQDRAVDAESYVRSVVQAVAPEAFLQAARSFPTAKAQSIAAANAGGSSLIPLWAGDYGGAIPGARQALEDYRALGKDGHQAVAAAQLGVVQYLAGAYGDAECTFAELEQLAVHLHDTRRQAQAVVGLGIVHYLRSNLDSAERHFRRALDLCGDPLEWLDRIDINLWLAAVHRDRGEHAAAAQLLGTALEECESRGHRDDRAVLLTRYGWIHTLLRDWAKAASILNEALESARQLDLPIDEAEALEALGELHLREGRRADGLTRLREAQQVCDRYAIPEGQRITKRLAGLTTASGL